MDRNMSTISVHGGESKKKPYNSLTTPMVLSSTFPFEDTAEIIAYKINEDKPSMQDRLEYGRYGNPTVRTVEKKLAALEGADGALLFSSGMNAITTTMLALLSSGDHLIMIQPVYKRSLEFTGFLARWGIETSFVESNNFENLRNVLRPNTRLIFAETPSNPTLRILDLETLTATAREAGILTMVDSTFATPINLRPLSYGVDLVVHSATKYLGGHNDLLAGSVAGRRTLLVSIQAARDILGGVLSPADAYLLLRGIKTLALRVQKQNQNGQQVAEFLEEHPLISRVHYPGLPSHPDYEIARRLLTGCGGVVSFEVAGSGKTASTVIDNLQLPYIGPTLGGVESIAQQQAMLISANPEERKASGIPDQLIRYALGIEDAVDILADLEQALQKAASQEPGE
ncbi:MAG: PLP-dependent transferase [Anaerolineales bacterium]|nr:PLP-dependent transferase [Anaerolineales bacterium]